MSKHIASVPDCVFQVEEVDFMTVLSPQRDSALHFCHKNLADLQEVCGSVPISWSEDLGLPTWMILF